MLKIGIDNGHGTGFKCKTSSLIFSNINIFFVQRGNSNVYLQYMPFQNLS